MRTIEEEAKFIFGDLETGIGAEHRRIWLWGAKSKQVEAEKIKAQIEILKSVEYDNYTSDGMGYNLNHTVRDKIESLEKQLKELEDEQ